MPDQHHLNRSSINLRNNLERFQGCESHLTMYCILFVAWVYRNDCMSEGQRQDPRSFFQSLHGTENVASLCPTRNCVILCADVVFANAASGNQAAEHGQQRSWCRQSSHLYCRQDIQAFCEQQQLSPFVRPLDDEALPIYLPVSDFL